MKTFFDIETEGLPLKDIEPLMPEFTAPGNIKDPIKIAAAIEDKKKDWLEGAALKAITGKIIAVSLIRGNTEPEFIIGDEENLIERLVGELKATIALNATAYVWNGHGFDLPFLCQRAAVHGIPAFGELMTNRNGRFYWNSNLLDPKLIWANYSPDHTGTSLKSVAYALGVGVKVGSGKDYAALLKSDPQKAEEYSKNDVKLLKGIVERLGI